MPYAYHLHYDVVARRCSGRTSHGLAPRSLLPWLLLASLRHSLSARHHEYCSDGGITLIILAEKTLPWPRLAPYAAAVALVLYGALVIASPQLLFPERWQRGYARRDADEDARERQYVCHEVVDPIFDVGSPMSAFGTKRTCASALHMSAFRGKADVTIRQRLLR